MKTYSSSHIFLNVTMFDFLFLFLFLEERADLGESQYDSVGFGDR